jgi:DNA topoisomerase III
LGKILIIAEKPSVGRDIAKVLKCTSKSDGYLFSEKYIVSWAIGHLVTLFQPEDYDSNLKKWNKNTLPIFPSQIKLKAVPKTKKQLSILKTLMNSKDVDSLICATDSGREGELIFRYIYSITKCKKPFKRLWISSMTDTAIKEGFKNIKDGHLYDNLYYSAKCRSEADWLVGINASRAYTIKYNTLISIGRVQTPTLAIIVNKQKEIDSFKPQNYFEVKGNFGNFFGLWCDPKKHDTKILDKSLASTIVSDVKNKTGTISNISKEEKKQPPGLLYDLTELQRDCNKKFGFSAKKTLSLAQDLYEKNKLITYPRTDSRYLSLDIVEKLNIKINNLNIDPYKPFVSYIKGLNKLPITKRIVDDSKVSDHHAIIPTDSKINISSLSADSFKVYDLIVRKFLSVFYPPYIYEITKIITTIDKHNFLTKGTTVKQLGFMELLKPEKLKDEIILPKVSINQKFNLMEVEILTKETKPPKPYTEGTLLSAMENAGKFIEDEVLKEKLKDSALGTPATRASTIERLIEVGYITRNGKSIAPTQKGTTLISILPSQISSPETTGKWERGLTSIAKGTMEKDKFNQSIQKFVNFIVHSSENSPSDISFPLENKKYSKYPSKAIGTCPKCSSGSILENSKAFYCSNWKNSCKFSIWKNSVDDYGVNLTPSIIKKLLIDKKAVNIKLCLPQTNEKCTADLIIKEELNGGVALINLNRI